MRLVRHVAVAAADRGGRLLMFAKVAKPHITGRLAFPLRTALAVLLVMQTRTGVRIGLVLHCMAEAPVNVRAEVVNARVLLSPIPPRGARVQALVALNGFKPNSWLPTSY